MISTPYHLWGDSHFFFAQIPTTFASDITMFAAWISIFAGEITMLGSMLTSDLSVGQIIIFQGQII